jgi:hypothetical protein
MNFTKISKNSNFLQFELKNFERHIESLKHIYHN